MVNDIIFRNDDVSRNTDLRQLEEIYSILRNFEQNAQIWSAVTVFSRFTKTGAVYPSLPLKGKPLEYFLDVDQCFQLPLIGDSKTVSHGLWHFDHSKADAVLQKASILSSCKLLYTDIFVPPFNNWNENTEIICKENGIQLVKFDDGWKSFEHNEFDPNHKLWYFHSWKWTPEKLREYLAHGYSKVMS